MSSEPAISDFIRLGPQGSFRPGEMLSWRTQPHAGQAVQVRSVRFVKQVGRDEADVEFGMDTQRVPLDELSRTVPKPPVFAPPPRPVPVALPVAQDLGPLREALKSAHDRKAAQQQAVDAAAELVNRGEANLDKSRQLLASIKQRERDRAAALEHSIRTGATDTKSVTADDSIGISRMQAADAVERAELVLGRFHEELRAARAKLADIDNDVHIAAMRVVHAIADREGAKLAEIEQQAAGIRAELKVVDQMLMSGKMPISAPLAALIANPPQQVEEPAGWEVRAKLNEGRTARWRALLDALTAGDAEADL